MPFYRQIVFFTGVLILAGGALAQSPSEHYRTKWERGAYQEALETLERWLGEDRTSGPRSFQRDYAELLFAVGRVDEAIGVLEDVTSRYASPAHTVRLALLYRYRGRSQDFREALDRAQQQIEMRLVYGVDREDWVAMGRLMELRGEDPKRVLGHYRRLTAEHPDYAPGFVAAGDLADLIL